MRPSFQPPITWGGRPNPRDFQATGMGNLVLPKRPDTPHQIEPLPKREAIVPGGEVGMSLKPYFSTPKGQAYLCSIEDFLNSKKSASLKGKVNLILTTD